MERHKLYSVNEIANLQHRISDLLGVIMQTKGEPRPEETAWLMEWPGGEDGVTRWWHPERGWTIDANRAARFARKEDAEAFIKTGRFVAGIVATEHKWIGLPVAAVA